MGLNFLKTLPSEGSRSASRRQGCAVSAGVSGWGEVKELSDGSKQGGDAEAVAGDTQGARSWARRWSRCPQLR